MEIHRSSFLLSVPSVEQLPEHNMHEFAFIGRSNVGKSSLINMLCGNNGLAHTSSTPGKTQLINRFLIDDRWTVVDLPGYGFAKVSKLKREALSAMIFGYICRSRQMTLLFVLLDCRHPLQKIDLEFLLKLGELNIPFALIFTKADKLSRTALEKKIQSIKKELLEYWEELPPSFVSSSTTSLGRREVLDYIGTVLAENT